MASHTPKSSNGSHYSPRVAPPQPKPLPGGAMIDASTDNLVPSQSKPRPHPLSQTFQQLEDLPPSSDLSQKCIEINATSSHSYTSNSPPQRIPSTEQSETPERTPVRLIRQVTTNLNLINGDVRSKGEEKLSHAIPQTPCAASDSSINTSIGSHINYSSISTDSIPFKIHQSSKIGVVYSFSPESILPRTLYIGATALITAVQHFSKTYCETGFVIGQGEEETNSSIFLDRFDPGRKQGGTENKVPTTMLHEDLLYEIIKVSNKESKSDLTTMQFGRALEELDRQLVHLANQPSSLTSVFFTCHLQGDGQRNINCNVVVPNVHFRLRYIKPLKVMESEILSSLRMDERIGYILLDNAGLLNIVSEESIKKKQNRIVGLWASNIQISDSRLVDKIVQYIAWRWKRNGNKSDTRPMILLLFNFIPDTESLDRVFLECLPKMEHPKFLAYSCYKKIPENDSGPLRFDFWDFKVDASLAFRKSIEDRFGVKISNISKPEFSPLQSPKTPLQGNSPDSRTSCSSVTHSRNSISPPSTINDKDSTPHQSNDSICEFSHCHMKKLDYTTPIDTFEQGHQYAGHTPHPSRVSSISPKKHQVNDSILLENSRAPRVTFASQEEVISNENSFENSDMTVEENTEALSHKLAQVTGNRSVDDLGTYSEFVPTRLLKYGRTHGVYLDENSLDTYCCDYRLPSRSMYPPSEGHHTKCCQYHETPSKCHHNTTPYQDSKTFKDDLHSESRTINLYTPPQSSERMSTTCNHCDPQHGYLGGSTHDGRNRLHHKAKRYHGAFDIYDEPLKQSKDLLNSHSLSCPYCHQRKPCVQYICNHCRSNYGEKQREHLSQMPTNSVHETDRHHSQLTTNPTQSHCIQSSQKKLFESPPVICKCTDSTGKAPDVAHTNLSETKWVQASSQKISEEKYRNWHSIEEPSLHGVECCDPKNRYSQVLDRETLERTDLDRYDFHNDYGLVKELISATRLESEPKESSSTVKRLTRSDNEVESKACESRLNYLQQQIDQLRLQIANRKNKPCASNPNQIEAIVYQHISTSTTALSQDSFPELSRHDVGVNTTLQQVITRTALPNDIKHNETKSTKKATGHLSSKEVKRNSRTRIREQRLQITQLLRRVNDILAESEENGSTVLDGNISADEESEDIYVAEVASTSGDIVSEGIKDKIASIISNPEESFSLYETEKPSGDEIPAVPTQCFRAATSQSIRTRETVLTDPTNQRPTAVVRDMETQTSQILEKSVFFSKKGKITGKKVVLNLNQEQAFTQTQEPRTLRKPPTNEDSKIFVEEIDNPIETCPESIKEFTRNPTLPIHRLDATIEGSHDAVDRIVNRYLRR